MKIRVKTLFCRDRRPRLSARRSHETYGTNRYVCYNLYGATSSTPRKMFALTQASLREGGGTRSVTEGACVVLDLVELYHYALSLTRLRRELPPGGSLSFHLAR